MHSERSELSGCQFTADSANLVPCERRHRQCRKWDRHQSSASPSKTHTAPNAQQMASHRYLPKFEHSRASIPTPSLPASFCWNSSTELASESKRCRFSSTKSEASTRIETHRQTLMLPCKTITAHPDSCWLQHAFCEQKRVLLCMHSWPHASAANAQTSRHTLVRMLQSTGCYTVYLVLGARHRLTPVCPACENAAGHQQLS